MDQEAEASAADRAVADSAAAEEDLEADRAAADSAMEDITDMEGITDTEDITVTAPAVALEVFSE